VMEQSILRRRKTSSAPLPFDVVTYVNHYRIYYGSQSIF
jgi:hypothetical protein